ncbi:MAG: hypothetical protein GWN58_57560, partial [Anaerolineae bacterium]|nr:hypothetical protein [Anaerolineae bacterium]
MARGQDIRFTEDRIARLQYAREVEGRDLGGIDSFGGALENFGRAVRGDVTRGYREGGIMGALGGLASGQSLRTQALQQSIAVMEAAGFDKFQGATVEDIRKGGIGQELGVINAGMRLAAEAGIESPLGAIPGLGMFGMGQAEQTRRGSDVVRGAVTDLFGDARVRVGSEVVGDIFSAKGLAKGVLSGGGLTALDLISGVGKVLEQGTAQDAFTEKLATDPEAGALLQEYLAAEAEGADDSVKMQALNALKERLGSEAESFMPQIYAALADDAPGGKREKLLKSFGPGGDMSKFLDRAAFGKATEGKRTRISKLKTADMERKQRYSKDMMGRIKDLKTTISRELAKGDRQDFGVQAAAVQTFIRQAAVNRDIDPEEMKALTEIFGVEGAEAGQVMRDALSGRLS